MHINLRHKCWTVFILFLSQVFIFEGCSRTESELENKTVLPDTYEQRFYQGLRFGLFVPESYDSTHSYPLVIYLHGSTDTVSWDLSWYHEPVQKNDPCFVLTPKSVVRKNGWGTSWLADYSEDMKKTLEVLDLLLAEFYIDTNRLYIQGASMGGFGVFSVLAKQPGRFAGAFSICGGGDPETAEQVKQTPLWIFHGSQDEIVPVENSRNIYHAILKAGGTQVRYTEYPGVGHAAWTPARKEPTLQWWLLAQRRGVKHGKPDPPENFILTITRENLTKLTWQAPSHRSDPDNQIWYYRLFRDDSLLVQIDNIKTIYIDSTFQSNSSPEYQISAVNYFFKESAKVGLQSEGK